MESAIARCAVSATSAYVFSIEGNVSPTFHIRQVFTVIHSVASQVATCSSSAAANILTSFTIIDAENRLSAPQRVAGRPSP